MPRVQPFRALRPAGRPAVDTSGLIDAPNPAALLRRWRDAGELVQDLEPALYVIEVQTIATLAGARRPPVRFLLGSVAAGEGVFELEETPRTSPPLAPVPTLAADDRHAVRELLSQVVQQAPPGVEARAGGQLHRLWRLGPSALRRRLLDVLDGTPLRPLGPLPEGAPMLAAVVSFPDPGLAVHPVHRALRGVDTFREETFLQLVPEFARVHDLPAPLDTPAGRDRAEERLGELGEVRHAVLLVLPGGRGKVLRFREGLDLAHLKAGPRSPTLRSLDLALLNALVLRTVLGLREPGAAGHPQVFPVESLDALVEQVDRGLFQAGFALNAPPAWEIRAVIEAAQTLPARTLTVDPLPPAGLLFLAPEP